MVIWFKFKVSTKLGGACFVGVFRPRVIWKKGWSEPRIGPFIFLTRLCRVIFVLKSDKKKCIFTVFTNCFLLELIATMNHRVQYRLTHSTRRKRSRVICTKDDMKYPAKTLLWASALCKALSEKRLSKASISQKHNPESCFVDVGLGGSRLLHYKSTLQ